MEQGLALFAAAVPVAGQRTMAELGEVARHRLPAPDLAFIVRAAPSYIATVLEEFGRCFRNEPLRNEVAPEKIAFMTENCVNR